MEEQQGGSFTHGAGGGLDSLRKRCFPGGGVNRKIGCVIRPCWVPTHFHQVLHNRADWGPGVRRRRKAESWSDVKCTTVPPKGHMGGDFVLGQPSLCLSLYSILFQAHGLCPKVLRLSSQLHLHRPSGAGSRQGLDCPAAAGQTAPSRVGRILNKDIQVSSLSASSGSPGLVLLAPGFACSQWGWGGCPLWLR